MTDRDIATLRDFLTAIRDSLELITPQNVPVYKALLDKAISKLSESEKKEPVRSGTECQF